VCRVGLLDGQAEHRDFVLDEEEFDTQIMICVSRATTNELVLDL
jgi:phthalate 4,5-dioxygenase reductase subunit